MKGLKALKEFDLKDYEDSGDFFLLSKFDKMVKADVVNRCDGYGEIVYIDKNAKLFIDTESSIFQDGLNFEDNDLYPIAVMWYNK